MRYFINLRRLFILLALICTACGTALPSVKPFKLEVQQGNVVTSKMLLQLRPGMTKSQVRFIMGTPLIQDSFHGKRWDYAYQLREGGKLKEQRRVILDFENDLLKTVRGDVMAAGSPEAAAFAAKDAADAAAKAGDNKATDAKPAEISENPNANKKAEPAMDGKMVAPPALLPGAEKAVTPVVTPPVVAPKVVKALPEVVPAPLLPIASPEVPVEPVAAVMPTITTVAEANLPVAVPAEPLQPMPVVTETAAPVEVAATVLPETPAAPDQEGYQSSAGMLFDRSLKLTPIDAMPMANEASAATTEAGKLTTKSGNVMPPAPKPLPAESESSFFDRMLEKIGF